MGWETINGRRYFYETTYVDNERIRHCWGYGLDAMKAAARVEREQEARKTDIAWLKATKERNYDLDHRIATLNARIHKTINTQLSQVGYHYLRGQWRKIHKSIMNAQTNLLELKTQVLNQNEVQPVTPQESEQLSSDIRRLALESLRGLSNPDVGPRVTLSCNVNKTIGEVEAKVQSLRDDFQYEHANSFDKLVIDQLTTSWVHWYVAGWLLDGELAANRTHRQNQYFTQRYHQCQGRLTKAIDQLTRIRQIPNGNLHITTQEERDANSKKYREEFDARRAQLMAEIEAETSDEDDNES